MENKSENRKEKFYAVFLFLLWPFLAAISALVNFRKKWAKNVMWAFVAFFGFTYAMSVDSENSDIVRTTDKFQNLHQVEMTFGEALDNHLNSGEIDIFSYSIHYVLSRFTDRESVLTLVYGIIFGFFFSRNMWFVLERLEGKLKPITILLLFCLFLVIPIWHLGGFRMQSASHIFIYGSLLYLGNGNKKGLALSCCSFLVHYSLLLPIAILLMYTLAGNRTTLFFGFYMMTFFLAEIDIEKFNSLFEAYMPEVLQERSASYRSETRVEGFRQYDYGVTNWYAIWYRKALNWSVMGFFALLYFFSLEHIRQNENWINLFSFGLLFFGVVNLFKTIPSGSRYLLIASLMALAFIIWYIQNNEHEIVMKRFIPFATPALLLFIVVSFRASLVHFSVATIIGNPIIAMFIGNKNLSLNDILRMIL